MINYSRPIFLLLFILFLSASAYAQRVNQVKQEWWFSAFTPGKSQSIFSGKLKSIRYITSQDDFIYRGKLEPILGKKLNSVILTFTGSRLDRTEFFIPVSSETESELFLENFRYKFGQPASVGMDEAGNLFEIWFIDGLAISVCHNTSSRPMIIINLSQKEEWD